MIFNFTNELDKEINIYFEPSTDVFCLKKGDVIKINILGEPVVSVFEIGYVNDGAVIYFSSKVKIEVFINDLKVDTLYEKFSW